MFVPENTFSPELQFMYHCIAQKAMYKDKLLTKTIPEYIQNLLKPPKRILDKAKEPISEIKKLFSLVPKIDKKYKF